MCVKYNYLVSPQKTCLKGDILKVCKKARKSNPKVGNTVKTSYKNEKKHNRLEFKMPISIVSGKIKNRNYNRAQNNNSCSYTKP